MVSRIRELRMWSILETQTILCRKRISAVCTRDFIYSFGQNPRLVTIGEEGLEECETTEFSLPSDITKNVYIVINIKNMQINSTPPSFPNYLWGMTVSMSYK